MSLGEAFPAVLQACRAGADWAWAELYGEMAPAVLRYLRLIGVKEPEDLLGETFLRVVRSLPTFVGDERAFRAWVFTIARRRSIDDARSRGRRPVFAVSVDDLIRNGGRGDFEEEAFSSFATQRVVSILRELTPQQREVLTLRLLDGLTIDVGTRQETRRGEGAPSPRIRGDPAGDGRRCRDPLVRGSVLLGEMGWFRARHDARVAQLLDGEQPEELGEIVAFTAELRTTLPEPSIEAATKQTHLSAMAEAAGPVASAIEPKPDRRATAGGQRPTLRRSPLFRSLAAKITAIAVVTFASLGGRRGIVGHREPRIRRGAPSLRATRSGARRRFCWAQPARPR
ncbi:MAG: RNA polymerase sigma factor [Actinomycetota bacterium]